MGFHRFRKEHLFGKEPVQQRHARHCRTGDHDKRSRDRHVAKQSGESPQVPCASFVVDDAGRHEQRRLECRMVEHMEYSGDQTERAAETKQERD